MKMKFGKEERCKIFLVLFIKKGLKIKMPEDWGIPKRRAHFRS
jgi:hypothetical protein